jgi:hypothetical protein
MKNRGVEEENVAASLEHPTEEGGLHGLYLMGIFLACGFLPTLRWGGITSILVSLLRTKLGSHLIGQREGPADSGRIQGTLRLHTTSDLRVATWSIRDERRRVEWNQKKRG